MVICCNSARKLIQCLKLHMTKTELLIRPHPKPTSPQSCFCSKWHPYPSSCQTQNLRSHSQFFFSLLPIFNPLARVKHLPVAFILPFSVSIYLQLCWYYAGQNSHCLWPGLLRHHLHLVPSLCSCCVTPEIQSSYCVLPNSAWCGPCLRVWIHLTWLLLTMLSHIDVLCFSKRPAQLILGFCINCFLCLECTSPCSGLPWWFRQ